MCLEKLLTAKFLQRTLLCVSRFFCLCIYDLQVETRSHCIGVFHPWLCELRYRCLACSFVLGRRHRYLSAQTIVSAIPLLNDQSMIVRKNGVLWSFYVLFTGVRIAIEQMFVLDTAVAG